MSKAASNKIALIGGGGVRTPLVIFGIQESAQALHADELVLFDPDAERVRIMADLGRGIVAREGGSLRIRIAASAEDAIAGAGFVLSSLRVGGIASRAQDERIALAHGYPGQETTGPGGFAMGLRTVNASIGYARLMEKHSPDGWLINFTNPAGMITQAISHHTGVKVVGICDTPIELFHRIATALQAPPERVRCDYMGLNHLGWVHRIRLDGKDVLQDLLGDNRALGELYPGNLFDPDLLRSLQMLPTEYLYFYYCRRRALANQRAAGTTRGEEVARLNERLLAELAGYLQSGQIKEAIAAYTAYLNQRSGSYMKLEASAGSAFDEKVDPEQDPFRTATGYHRIALDVMNALIGATPRRIVVNVPNRGAITDIGDEDIVEVPCTISDNSIQPEACGALPEAARGLVLSVKAYERAVIQAALSGSALTARKAMLLYPPIGEWEPSETLLEDILKDSSTRQNFGHP
ncbi:6-phospho-beta-glucosidase [Paracidobacterium acidisoli]|uniref:6-phospho-beta-glucosidase n=1 Tax=Paracidobacterium acidisoli TaxID=2303751 RepID=A0A372IS07_9BACT|nr:6-phospho-beta-glucosidase [Paracidobacterium acidisoli]MBT9330595.1 hypothetical protein [Paracidobacterium acidisoli]